MANERIPPLSSWARNSFSALIETRVTPQVRTRQPRPCSAASRTTNFPSCPQCELHSAPRACAKSLDNPLMSFRGALFAPRNLVRGVQTRLLTSLEVTTYRLCTSPVTPVHPSRNLTKKCYRDPYRYLTSKCYRKGIVASLEKCYPENKASLI